MIANIGKELLRFIVVGLLNTFLGLVTLFAFYDLLGLGYWGASALSYFLCSIISFFLNKNFTFKSKTSLSGSAWRFALNIGICYLISYSMAKPLVAWLLMTLNLNLSLAMIERIALLMGMGLFTGLNYLGQKFFVFGE